jgi:hypothetical protein
MNKDSESEEKIVRREFRIPVQEKDNIRMRIKGKEYALTNLASRGAQIVYRAKDDFEPDADLGRADLVLGESRIVVRARVMYTTKFDLELFACGLYFYELEREDLEFLEEFISRKRASLFPDT